MSYEKTNWQKGDVITAEKLNKIEDRVAANEEAISSAGGDDSVFIVNIDAEDNSGTITHATADKTRQEMSAAVEAGKPIIIRLTRNYPTPQPSSIHEMTLNIWSYGTTGGYYFSAEKIISSVMSNAQRSISTVKVQIGTYNEPDTITVNLYTYSFA